MEPTRSRLKKSNQTGRFAKKLVTKAYQTPLFPVYVDPSEWRYGYITKPGKFSKQLRNFRGKRGVYRITLGGKTIYVGKSVNLYRTVIRHFQRLNDNQQRTQYKGEKGHKVQIIAVQRGSEKFISWLENQLLKKYNPPDNIMKYSVFFEETVTAAQAIDYNTIAAEPVFINPDEIPF